MKRLVRILSLTLALVIACMAITTPAVAEPPDRTERQYTKAIKQLERFLVLEDGNIVLDAPRGVLKRIDPEVLQTLLLSLEYTNSMVDSGYLICNDDFTLTVTDQYLELSDGLVAEGNTVSSYSYTYSYRGVNKIVYYWWGFFLYLNDYTCDRVVAGLGIGAILCAFIPEPLVSKVAAAVMVICAGSIMATNVYNRGVIIRFHYLWIFGPVPTGIWSQ